jgi:hypothetical protein
MAKKRTLINKTYVKKFCLEMANSKFSSTKTEDKYTDGNGRVWNLARAMTQLKGRKFTQVSDSLLNEIEAEVRVLIENKISNNRQFGKTVR